MHPLLRDIRHHRLKLDTEQDIVESHLNWTIVQPARYMQHLVPIWSRVLEDGVHAMPFKMRFRTSGLYISVSPPLVVGLFVGVLSAIMGVGGGFIMVPAMIYLLGMPTKVVVGTSLFQIIFVTAFTTMLHATTNYTVDVVLAVLLLVGGVVGAQIGTVIGARMPAEQLRVLLAALVLVVCGKLALDLLLQPAELYSLGDAGGH